MTRSSPEPAEFLRLIVITDEEMARPHGGVERAVSAALDAGCRAIQLRMKDAAAAEMVDAARPLRSLTREAGALLFVNDRLDVALAVGADGVHLGPDDLSVEAARAAARNSLVSPFLVGYSSDDPAEARAAERAGADYIGCGTVFPTGSKVDAGELVGIEGLRSVVQAVEIPVVGIGGIDVERAASVGATGAAGIAVVSAVMSADDPGRATVDLLADLPQSG